MAYTWYNLTKVAVIAPPDQTDPDNSYWLYKDTTLALATLLSAAFLNAASSVSVGDVVLLVGLDGTTHARVTADARASGGNLNLNRTGFVSGTAATVTASDTIVTGLQKVYACGATLNDAPVLTCDRASATPGTQAGAPAAGSIYLQTWMPTSNANPTPIAATTFGKNASWWAFGE